ncbi:MAG TPA: hypothetical protein VIM41_14195 [Gammaproteobacteria bacterium]
MTGESNSGNTTGNNTSINRQNSLDDQVLLAAARSTLEDSLEQIDADTLSSLAALRRHAVDAASSKLPVLGYTRWYLPVGALATAMSVGVLVFTPWTEQPTQSDAPVTALEDLNLLTTSDEIELFKELEFYQWLAVNEQTAS